MSGAASFEAFIARVEELRDLNEQIAKAAEPDVAKAARETANDGETPSGAPWPEKKGGGRALDGAGDAIKSSVRGNRITLQIGEPFVFHTWGAGGSSTTKKAAESRRRTERKRAVSGTKSKFHAPRRQILPVSGEPIPDPMTKAIAAAAERVFGKAMG
jgi:hypothetical protein